MIYNHITNINDVAIIIHDKSIFSRSTYVYVCVIQTTNKMPIYKLMWPLCKPTLLSGKPTRRHLTM